MQGEADAVIGDAVLREVIRAELFAAVAGLDHVAPLRAQRGLLLFQLDLVMQGRLQLIVDALIAHYQAEQLKGETQAA